MTDELALEGVSVRLGGSDVLQDLSLAVSRGEVLALLGPSGSGKSTLLRVLLGFIAPRLGRVRIGGRIATAGGAILLPAQKRGLSVVFQDLALWPHLTVAGNLDFVLASRGLPKAERARRIGRILERVSLDGMQGRYPGELSGGERQRVAIARALVPESAAVLFDEPLTNLDADLRRELLALLRELLEERGATAIYVTHDLREAISLGQRVAVLEAGRVVQSGSPQDLRADPATPFIRAMLEDVAWVGSPPRND